MDICKIYIFIKTDLQAKVVLVQYMQIPFKYFPSDIDHW